MLAPAAYAPLAVPQRWRFRFLDGLEAVVTRGRHQTWFAAREEAVRLLSEKLGVRVDPSAVYQGHPER